MLNLPMSGLEEKLLQFLRGNLSTAEFEQWLYNTPELETLFGPDLFLELISLDYRDDYATTIMKVRLKVWFNERHPDIPKIDVDCQRGIVRINGHEIEGRVAKYKCSVCNSSLVWHGTYDSLFCPLCNEWAEPPFDCKDPECPYCGLTRSKRPLKGPT